MRTATTFLLFTLLLAATSCNWDDCGPFDTSPGWSASGTHYVEYEVYQNGDLLQEGSPGRLDFNKVSEKSVKCYLQIQEGLRYHIELTENLPTGNSGQDISFDQTLKGNVTEGEKRYEQVDITVRGWMKNKYIMTRCSPPEKPEYNSEIDFSFTIADDNYRIRVRETDESRRW